MFGSNIRDTDPPQVGLSGDRDIGELSNKPEGTVSEKELRDVLSSYNLRDGLIVFGRASNYVQNAKGEEAIGRGAIRDPRTGVIVSQFGLAYLANALIMSGTNDYKKKIIGKDQNLLLLSQIYNNCLVFPEIQKEDSAPFTKKDFMSLMVRMNSEQFEYQFNAVLLVARTILIFTDIIDLVKTTRFEPLDTIFKRETNLTFEEYLYLVIAVWAATQKTATFRKEALTQAQIPSMQEVLTDEKVSDFLKILSTDYSTFRSEDDKVNSGLDPIFTKFRFNPLLIYPIIKTDQSAIDPYVIPNTVAFVKRAFGGLYWWFHRYFETLGNWHDFRNYYGEVFEQYVGKILKQMYGEKNVHPEIIYKNGKFIDWWIEKDSKIYLFEVKAYQFALPTKQTGGIELLINEVRKKIVQTIEQVYKRVQDIESYSELSIFRQKKIIPTVVFMEIPLASVNLYKEIIEEELIRLEESGMKGIRDMKIHFLNVEELELYSDAVDKIPLEEVFDRYENNPAEGFLSTLQKEMKIPLRNSYLDTVYNEFWKKITGKDYSNF